MKAKPFQFQQFKVFQDQCAMKIGTDGVLLGAWTSINNSNTILDIGSGTGLIALMLAQRTLDSKISAVELDEHAFSQASSNFDISPWSDRLQIFHTSIQEFAKESAQHYDLIVSNPPFFEVSTQQKGARSLARSEQQLSLEELVMSVSSLLSPKGRFSIVIPFDREAYFLNLCEAEQLYPLRICRVKGNEQSKVKRSLVELAVGNSRTIDYSTLVIEPKERHVYSEAYRSLLADFLTIFK